VDVIQDTFLFIIVLGGYMQGRWGNGRAGGSVKRLRAVET